MSKLEKYLGNQEGFQNYNHGHQEYNCRNTNRNYTIGGQHDRPSNRDQGNRLIRVGIEMIIVFTCAPR